MKNILTILTIFTTFLVASSVSAFSDLPENHIAFDSIKYLENIGVLAGYEDGTVRPDNKINRAEFTKILIASIAQDKLDGLDLQPLAFSDIEPGAWYEPYMQQAVALGYIQGYPDGTLRPGNNITLVEVAKLVVLSQLGESKVMSDIWYAPYMLDLMEKNAVPYGVNALDQQISRADMAEIMYRLKDNINARAASSFFSNKKIYDVSYGYAGLEELLNSLKFPSLREKTQGKSRVFNQKILNDKKQVAVEFLNYTDAYSTPSDIVLKESLAMNTLMIFEQYLNDKNLSVRGSELPEALNITLPLVKEKFTDEWGIKFDSVFKQKREKIMNYANWINKKYGFDPKQGELNPFTFNEEPLTDEEKMMMYIIFNDDSAKMGQNFVLLIIALVEDNLFKKNKSTTISDIQEFLNNISLDEVVAEFKIKENNQNLFITMQPHAISFNNKVIPGLYDALLVLGFQKFTYKKHDGIYLYANGNHYGPYLDVDIVSNDHEIDLFVAANLEGKYALYSNGELLKNIDNNDGISALAYINNTLVYGSYSTQQDSIRDSVEFTYQLHVGDKVIETDGRVSKIQENELHKTYCYVVSSKNHINFTLYDEQNNLIAKEDYKRNITEDCTKLIQ